MKLTFEIEALEDGEDLDQAETLVFQRHLSDLLSHADYMLRIGPAELAPPTACCRGSQSGHRASPPG